MFEYSYCYLLYKYIYNIFCIIGIKDEEEKNYKDLYDISYLLDNDIENNIKLENHKCIKNEPIKMERENDNFSETSYIIINDYESKKE